MNGRIEDGKDSSPLYRGQLLPEAGAGQSTSVKVRHMKMLIRTVEIVGISSPAEQQGIESQDLFKAEYHWN